jgi:GMP synthase (glutamine-hydrolysing)
LRSQRIRVFLDFTAGASGESMNLHLLVIEGNTREDRETYRVGFGRSASEAYTATLREIAPDAICEICFPADGGARLPDAAGLEAYDGVFITGSALNLYDGGPAITRQIDLARAVFASRTPFFGSCWGLQVATAAAGGEVLRNPKGREIGFARNIFPTEAGRAHPLLAGRAAAYDAICSHLDIVTPAPGALVLAANAMSAVQAAEIVWEGGSFWGVQYHPEYSLREIAAIVTRRGSTLAREGFFPDERDALAYAEDLRTLDAAPQRREIAWRLALSDDVLDPVKRRAELINFIDDRVRPEKSRRGRG